MNLLLSQSSAGFRPGFPVCPGFLFMLVSTVSLTETCIHCHFQSLLPLSFPLFCFTYNFFYLYLLFSVCQALLEKKKKKMFEKVTVSFHYPFLLFNFFVPSHVPVSVRFHLWLVLRFLFSTVCGCQPHVPCSGKLRGPITACAEGLPTCTVLVLGIRRVAAVFCFSRVGAVLALTLPPFFSHAPSLIPRGCPSGV